MLTKNDPAASINLIRERLVERGYRIESFRLDKQEYYRFISPSGRSWTVRIVNISYPFPTASAAGIGRNKVLSNKLAERAHIPVPASLIVAKGGSIKPVVQLLRRYKRIVIKPLDASLGRGLTLDITDESELQAALDLAHEFSHTAIVQQQVSGEEIRFPVMNGKVQAALPRRTPRVTGDGTHTVAELIAIENKARAVLRMPYLTYPQLTKAIIDAHLLRDPRVLATDETLELGRGTMIKKGASIYNVLDQLHPSYIGDVERLADLYGHGFIVVDMFIQDFTAPKTAGNNWFIEFNTAPVLKLFYSCRDGKMFDVLGLLAPMIDEVISGTKHTIETLTKQAKEDIITPVS